MNGISVVVATKGRVRLLEELLAAVLEARKQYQGPCEVILVDDSVPREQEEIAALCETYDARLERYSNTVAKKRNHGVEISRYELVLFLDSDCRPVPEILSRHEACYKDARTGAAAGPLEFVGEENWFWKCVTLTPYLICFQMPFWGKTVPWGATANFSVRKEVFEQIGGFSADFPNKPGGEDVDLGLLITEAGYTIASAPEALVYHAKETWSKAIPMYRRAWHYGAADYYLVNRHQELCCRAVPRRTVIAFAVFLVFLLLSVLRSPWYLMGILLWSLSDIGIMAAIMAQTGFQKSGFFRQCVVQTLIIVNEIGYIGNCLCHGRADYVNEQIVYFENQLKGTMTNAHATFWRTFLCSLIVLAFAFAGILSGWIG